MSRAEAVAQRRLKAAIELWDRVKKLNPPDPTTYGRLAAASIMLRTNGLAQALATWHSEGKGSAVLAQWLVECLNAHLGELKVESGSEHSESGSVYQFIRTCGESIKREWLRQASHEALALLDQAKWIGDALKAGAEKHADGGAK